MPGHRVHTFMDWQMFGRSYWKLHRAIDKPYLVFGRRHRIFFHDFPSAITVARNVFPGDLQAEQAAILHVQLDNICSQNPIYKKQLEVLADSYYKNKRGKKTKKKIVRASEPKLVVDLRAFINKINQAKDLIVNIRSFD